MDLDERELQMTLRLCAVVTLKNGYRHFSAESFGRRKQPPFFDGDLERFQVVADFLSLTLDQFAICDVILGSPKAVRVFMSGSRR